MPAADNPATADITHVSIATFPGLCLVPVLVAVTRNDSRAARALLHGIFGVFLLAAVPAVLMLALRKELVTDVPQSLPENVLDRFISSNYSMVLEDGRLQVWRLVEIP